jgi:thiol:disulfide interchange protein
MTKPTQNTLLIFVILWLICPPYTQAQNLKIQGSAIENVFKEAKKQDKLLLIDFYTDWCVTCRRMDSEVLSQPNITALIQDYFVPIKLNGDSFEAMDIADALGGIDAYPTYFVLNEKAQVVGKLVGYYAQTPLTQELDKMIEKDDLRREKEAQQKAAAQRQAQLKAQQKAKKKS